MSGVLDESKYMCAYVIYIFGVFYERLLVYMFSECVDEWCVWCVLTSYTQSSPAVTLSL